MTLRKCRECKEMISTDAAKCPHCGASNPTLQRAIISLISVIVVVLCFAWTYKSCSDLFKSNPASRDSSAETQSSTSPISTSTGINTANSESKPGPWRQDNSPTPQGPPQGYDGTGIQVDGLKLYVYRMAVHDPHVFQTCESFTGHGYSFLVFALDATSATEQFTWHCWTNRIVISLNDGRESKTIDLSDMEGFYNWELSEKFSCAKTVYPGKILFHYLAFYPSFAWKDVIKVTFFTGVFGHDELEASWIRIQ